MKKKFLTNKDKKEILRVFNKIENLRAKNNKNWMDVLKIAFKQIEIHFSSFFVLIIMEAFFIIFSLVPEVNFQNHSL